MSQRLVALALAAGLCSGCFSGAMASNARFWDRCEESGDCVLWMAGALTADITVATVAAVVAEASRDDHPQEDEADEDGAAETAESGSTEAEPSSQRGDDRCPSMTYPGWP